jgi:Fuc2NAc and GlcNAc transferase
MDIGWVINGIVSLVTFCLFVLYLRYAKRHGLLDQPNARSLHSRPVVQSAGIIFSLVWCFFLLVECTLGWLPWHYLVLFYPGIMVLSGLGFVDDLSDLSPKIRLWIQALVACYTVWMLGGVPTYQFGGHSLHLGWLGSFLAVMSIIWSINLFNFMDGADGFGCVQALFFFSASLLLFYYLGHLFLMRLMGLFLAPLFVLAYFNWPPARCFMGDSGAYCLGFLIVTLALFTQKMGLVSILTWGCLYAFFALDTGFTLVNRLARRFSVFQAHQEFLHHKILLNLGWHALGLLGVLILFDGYVAAIVFTSLHPAYISIHRAMVILIVWASLYYVVHQAAQRKR